jgi:hypothetical protein
MKSLSKKRMVVAAVVLSMTFLLICMEGTAFAAASSSTNSGIPGLEGPTFTLGLVLVGSDAGTIPSGAAGEVYNCFPWSITGYAMSKGDGAIHVWLSSATQAVLDLGFKPGDIISILCSESQVKNINSGDWVQIAGFTAMGNLVYAYQAVLTQPFGY